MTRFARILSAFGLVLGLAACGGGTGGTTIAPDEAQVPQDGDLKVALIDYGMIGGQESDGTGRIGGPTRSVGDTGTGIGQRILVTFSLGDIPANATIHDAHLRFSALLISGDPFARLGNLQVVRVVDANSWPGTPIDGAGLAHDPGSDLTSFSAPSLPVVDVTEVVRSSRNAGEEDVRMRIQFPLLSSGDGIPDFVLIATKIHTTAQPPVLEVRYTTPE